MLIALLLAIVSGQGPLNITVRSVDGKPVPDAHVVFHLKSGDLAMNCGPAGKCGVNDAAVLPVSVEVTARGFVPVYTTATEAEFTVTLYPAILNESIVVAAERPSVWHDPARGSTVLTRDELVQIPAETADESLKVLSGFSLFRRSSSRSANPTTNGVTMRGLSASGSSRGLVLLDGVPLNDGFGGWVTWTRLPPAAIESVDVTRGPVGDAFGSDALGGVVRFATPARYGPLAAQAGGDLGSFGTRNAGGSAGLRRGHGDFFGAFDWFHTDGTIPLEAASRGAIDTPTRAYWASGLARVSAVASNVRVTGSVWGGKDDRNNGTVVQVNHGSGETYSGSIEAVGADMTFAARVSRTPNSYYQTFTAPAAGRVSERLISTQTIDTTANRTVLEIGRSIPRGHILGRLALNRTGSHFVDTRPTTVIDKTLRDDSEAVSLQAALVPTRTISFDAGVRHEWRAAPTSADARLGNTVGHGAVAWTPVDRLTIRASAASSHRWPTLNELVRDFTVGAITTTANPALLPERARTFEGGATWTAKRWSIGGTGFATIVDDVIGNVTVNSTTRQRRNAGRAVAHGLETDLDLRPIAQLEVRLSLTAVRSYLSSSPEAALVNTRLPQVPRVAAGVWVTSHLPHGVDASLVVRATASQFDDDRNQFVLAPAYQVDARVAGRIGQLTWFVTGENLFDARIETAKTPLVSLAAGRAARVGLSWRR